MSKIKQIRIHGRGGQGVVAMAEILAIAFFNDGKTAQAFPHFGVERSGAPIQSFVRFLDVKDGDILLREHVYEPDFLVILDDSLLGKANVFLGIKKETKIIINSKLSRDDLLEQFKKITKLPNGFKVGSIFSSDASGVALEIFGKNMVNTAVLGALTKVSGLLTKEAAIKAVKEKFKNKDREVIKKNIIAINKITG